MSFILEALKKSERQRQEQKALPPKVRSRTLSLTSNPTGRRPYWLLAGILPLVLFCGWWLFSETEAPVAPHAVVNPSTSVAAAPTVAVTPEPAVVTPSLAIPAQQPVSFIEPAPVPREAVLSPPVSGHISSEQSFTPQNEIFTDKESATSNQSVVAAVIEASEPQAESRELQELPLYLDLSMALRDRMPPIAMSMHYYTAVPARRMVRINNRLLHEGDWVNDDLEVVEITPSGAILDFLGKSFELRSAGR